MPAYFLTAAPNDGPLRAALRLAVARPLRETGLEVDDDGVGMTVRFLPSYVTSSDSSPKDRVFDTSI